MARSPCPPARGFTLIELMVALAVAAVLAAVALPSYSNYVKRSRVPAALEGLNSFATRMEQRYQDSGSYANGTACGTALPTVDSFSLSCVISDSGQGYTATATGSGTMAGYAYTVNHQGVRATTAHPNGVPATACWSTKGSACDA